MTADAELFTIEQSHGKPRLTAPRLSDLESVPTGGDRHRDHNADGTFAQRNQAAKGRSARRALVAPLRAAAERVRVATAGEAVCERDRLLADANAVYASTCCELGTRSTLVLSALAAHACESVLAGHFVQSAAAVGLGTDEGGRLLGLAHSCETQASRAMTAALAAMKALMHRRRSKKGPPPGFETTGEEVR